MSSEIEGMSDLLDVLLGLDDRFTREEILDALALIVLDTVVTTGELPSDPELLGCLERWQLHVLRETSSEPDLDFSARARRYFEQRPPNAELLSSLERHFDHQSTKYERARARSEQLLAIPMARMGTSHEPDHGKSWLQVRVAVKRTTP